MVRFNNRYDRKVEPLGLESSPAGLVLLVTGFMLASCARHEARWTPEIVSPPESLNEALLAADRALSEARAALPAVREATLALTRDGAVLAALARNRSLAVERFGPDIAKASVTEARAEFDPRLLSTVSYGKDSRIDALGASASRGFNADAQITQFLPTGTEAFLSGAFSRGRAPSSDWTYTGSWSAGVNQELLRGAGRDVNLVALHQARNSEAISLHELRAFVLDLVLQVDVAYWELVLAEETLEIRRFSLELAEEQLRLNEDLIAVGKLARDARITAEAEVASRKADLVDAEAGIVANTIDLIRLLNPENEYHWSLSFDLLDGPEVAPVAIDPNMSARLADLYRPDLAQARLALANQKLEVIRTKNGLLPKLTAFASYGVFSSGDSSSDAWTHLDDDRYENYEVGLALDVSPFNRGERARNERALLRRKQAEAAVSNLEQLTETGVRQATVEVNKQWERIAATQRVVDSREEELRVERDRFRVGKSTNLDVLRVERDLVQAKLEEVTARIRFIQAVTALYYLEGTLLDRRGVGLTEIEEQQP